ncbi:MAG: hypothetical protein K6T30_03235, partial [Alicyclobacillus sp.]|nr:hypothetical protein [Alicyclobacillus sp.]
MRKLSWLPGLTATAAVWLLSGTATPALAAVIEKETSLVQSMHANLEQRRTRFTLTTVPSLSGRVAQALDMALRNDPYLNHDYASSWYSVRPDGDTVQIQVHMRYRESAAQYRYVLARVSDILSQILKPGMTDIQKELAIHDYIVLHSAYDTSLRNLTPYALLTRGTAVCQGYQMLTYLMLTRAGVPCKMVDGTAGGGGHSWVMVKIAGRWYHLDTTWDDPVPDQPGHVSYAYFNLTDAQISRDHAWNHTGLPRAATDFLQVALAHSQGASDAARAWQQVLLHTGLYLETRAYTYDNLLKLAGILRTKLGPG